MRLIYYFDKGKQVINQIKVSILESEKSYREK